MESADWKRIDPGSPQRRLETSRPTARTDNLVYGAEGGREWLAANWYIRLRDVLIRCGDESRTCHEAEASEGRLQDADRIVRSCPLSAQRCGWMMVVSIGLSILLNIEGVPHVPLDELHTA